jgi:hypothetical protein
MKDLKIYYDEADRRFESICLKIQGGKDEKPLKCQSLHLFSMRVFLGNDEWFSRNDDRSRGE